MNAEEAKNIADKILVSINLPGIGDAVRIDRATLQRAAELLYRQADDLRVIESHYRRWAPIIVPANDGWIVCGNSKTTHSTLADACRAAAAPKAN